MGQENKNRSRKDINKIKKSREHNKMRKKQGKSLKGTRGKKLTGTGSKRRNSERSREHTPLIPPSAFQVLCKFMLKKY